MFVRLKDSGAFETSSGDVQYSGKSSLEKRALLVYEGKFDSMDGPVEVTSAHLEKLYENHNSGLSKLKRMAAGSVSMKAFPPLQLDHSTSAVHTVGRVVGDIEKGTHVREDGQTVAALYGTPRVLGKENVEKVEDGRWIHLSVGADFEKGKFSELTITPFPAAEDASMLSRKNLNEGDPMKEKMKKHLMEHYKMSEEQAHEHMKKMHAYLMAHKKMSADDAEKHMASVDDEGAKKMAAEHDEHEKKMAAEEEEKKKLAGEEHEKKMSAARASLTKLSTDFRANNEGAKLAAVKAKISVRLSKLRSECKITPAEVKKMDLVKLASSNQATIDAVLKSYEDREPVIIPSMVGSTKGAHAGDVYKNKKLSALEAETRANMSLLSRSDQNKRLSDADAGVGTKVEPTVHQDQYATQGAGEVHAAHKMMEEHSANIEKAHLEGKHEEAHEHFKKMMEHYRKHLKHMALPDEEHSGHATETEMSALAESVNKMQTDFEALVQLASTLAGPDKK